MNDQAADIERLLREGKLTAEAVPVARLSRWVEARLD